MSLTSLPATSAARDAVNAWAPQERANACLLSFAAAFVDTCVFVGLFGLFTAHVTGNFVLIGAELVHHRGEVLGKLLSLPAFMLAVVLAVKVSDTLRSRGVARVPALLAIEVALLLACVVATAIEPPVAADAPWALVAGTLAAAAMGMQNALMRIELSTLPSTTVMTVNVTQVVVDAVKLFGTRGPAHLDPGKAREIERRFARTWPPILAFTAGAALGAFGAAEAGFWSLSVPALVCVVLAIRMRDR